MAQLEPINQEDEELSMGLADFFLELQCGLSGKIETL